MTISPSITSWFTNGAPVDQPTFKTWGQQVEGELALAKRERLTADRTYYVATTGSNSNSGLALGTPFLTIQKAIDVIAALDIGTFNVTIDIQTGTYTGGASVNGPWLGSGTVTIQGQQTAMGVGNTVISTTNAHAISCFNGGRVSVRRLDLRTITSGSCVYASTGGTVYLTGFMIYGPSAFAHLHGDPFGSIYVQADYTINGGGVIHWYSVGAHLNSAGRGIVVFINVTFSSAFAQADAGGRIVIFSVSFTNGANVTGTRYTATALGLVYTAGGGASYLPGTVAGSTGTGGQYT